MEMHRLTSLGFFVKYMYIAKKYINAESRASSMWEDILKAVGIDDYWPFEYTLEDGRELGEVILNEAEENGDDVTIYWDMSEWIHDHRDDRLREQMVLIVKTVRDYEQRDV